MSLDWRGDELVSKIRKAQMAGVNATMAEASISAKNSHEWKNRTSDLEGSIGISKYARRTSTGAEGFWGSQSVKYAIFHELGTARMRARPYLRPAADRTYPKLAANIKAAM